MVKSKRFTDFIHSVSEALAHNHFNYFSQLTKMSINILITSDFFNQLSVTKLLH